VAPELRVIDGGMPARRRAAAPSAEPIRWTRLDQDHWVSTVGRRGRRYMIFRDRENTLGRPWFRVLESGPPPHADEWGYVESTSSYKLARVYALHYAEKRGVDEWGRARYGREREAGQGGRS
jgi:hypothetical protein